MSSTYHHLLSTSLLLSLASALTITSPAPGASLDPSQPITLTWTSDAADPATIDINVRHLSPDSLVPFQALASNVDTAAGSFVIPAWYILEYGLGYQLEAAAPNGGAAIAQAGDLTLAGGDGQVAVQEDGSASIVMDEQAAAASAAAATAAPAATTPADAAAPTVTGTDANASADATATASAAVADEEDDQASTTTTASETASETETETESATESETATETATESASAATTTAVDSAAVSVKGGAAAGLLMVMGASVLTWLA